MTVADDICNGLWWAIARNDPKQMLEVARSFYDRFDRPSARITGIEDFSEHGFTLTIEPCEGCSLDSASYDNHLNRWDRGSDARVAEWLGVPVCYLRGMTYALCRMREFIDGADEKVQHFRREEQRLRSRQYDIEQLVRLTDEKVAEKEAVKAARKRAKDRADNEIAKYKQLAEACKPSHYHPVPEPTMTIAKGGRLDLPSVSGIYFIWEKRVEYVGQSINIANRVGLNHQNIQDGDRVSWVEIPKSELDFAEAYYIGILRPSRNFGKSARWHGGLAR